MHRSRRTVGGRGGGMHRSRQTGRGRRRSPAQGPAGLREPAAPSAVREHSLLPPLEDHAAVVAAEAETVVRGDLQVRYLQGLRGRVEVEPVLTVLEVQGRVHPAMPQRLHADDGLDPGGGPEAVAQHRLGAVDYHAVGAAQRLLDGPDLRHVPRGRGGAVAVDVAHLARLDAGVRQRALDAAGDSRTLGVRLRHVVRVGGVRAARVLGVDLRAARLRVLQGLQAQDAGTLAHDETVAALVPRAGSPLWLVVARGQGLARVESGDACARHGSLGAACEDKVAFPALDVASSRGNAIIACRACRDHSVVGACEANVD
mmetsp:Transcript_41091/g.110369  ORF Transcript_41091/g.110369 Transcript_41091/m.110369 type:complete len:315 (-) Transcript_41091:453-1397(-)